MAGGARYRKSRPAGRAGAFRAGGRLSRARRLREGRCRDEGVSTLAKSRPLILMRRLNKVLALAITAAAPLAGQYIGSGACRACHTAKFESQSKTGHARALAVARPGVPISGIPAPESAAQWVFGAGEKATTWVSQTGEETIAEHGLSYYAATKSLDLTPGHANSNDLVYPTFDPVGTALRCFRCHSTGPVTLAARYKVQPSEPGIHCEACHGPGSAHVNSPGKPGTIQNPK